MAQPAEQKEGRHSTLSRSAHLTAQAATAFCLGMHSWMPQPAPTHTAALPLATQAPTTATSKGCAPLCTTVGVPRCVLDSTMSIKSLAVGTDWMDLKLYA